MPLWEGWLRFPQDALRGLGRPQATALDSTKTERKTQSLKRLTSPNLHPFIELESEKWNCENEKRLEPPFLGGQKKDAGKPPFLGTGPLKRYIPSLTPLEIPGSSPSPQAEAKAAAAVVVGATAVIHADAGEAPHLSGSGGETRQVPSKNSRGPQRTSNIKHLPTKLYMTGPSQDSTQDQYNQLTQKKKGDLTF